MIHQIEGPPFPEFFLGLDLGKTVDFTALAVVERIARPGGLFGYAVVDLLRADLGTSYPTVVGAVQSIVLSDLLRPQRLHPPDTWRPRLKIEPAPAPTLVVDATGVGSAVVDLFLESPIAAGVTPVTITGGGSPRKDAWPGNASAQAFWVSKADLVGTMQTLMQCDRLKIVPDLELAGTLRSELETFEVRVTRAQNEVFTHRVGSHDDLVLAVATALWVAEHRTKTRSGELVTGFRDRRGRIEHKAIGPGRFAEMMRKYNGQGYHQ